MDGERFGVVGIGTNRPTTSDVPQFSNLHDRFTLPDVQCQTSESHTKRHFALEWQVMVEGHCDEQQVT